MTTTIVEERRDPIPPGTYWVDVVAMDGETYFRRLQAFSRWYRMNTGAVRLIREQEADRVAVPVNQGFHRFILFEVTSAVPRWAPDAGIGFPNVAAEKGGQTRIEDTRAPVPPSAPFSFPDLGGLLSGGLGLFVLLYVLTRK